MKKVFMFAGGWDGHQPKQCTDFFKAALEAEGCKTDIVYSLEPLADAELMRQYDLIVPAWTMGKISAEQISGLESAVASGTGLAGWHGGMGDAFRECERFQMMTGGQFTGHPGGIIDYKVNIVRPDDPVVAGIQDFDVTSEQYYMHVDPSNEVLATTTFSGAHGETAGVVMPVVWKRRFGNGKVFYCSLGHTADEFTRFPEPALIIRRGMLWAMR